VREVATLFVWNLFPFVRLSAVVGLIDQETVRAAPAVLGTVAAGGE
jgi:hypothetical protein